MTTNALAPLYRSPVATRKLVVFGCFLVSAVTLIPVVMMVLVAFQSDGESMAAKPSFWPSSWHRRTSLVPSTWSRSASTCSTRCASRPVRPCSRP